MEFSAQQIASFLHGEIIGDETVKVHDFSKIEEGKAGTLSFLSNPKYNHYIYDSNASIVLVNRDFIPEKDVKATMIKVDNAYEALAVLLGIVEQYKPKKNGVSSLAFISPTAKLGANVYVAPYVYVGDYAEIGNYTTIDASAYIGDNVKMGDNCQIHAGVKIEKECIIGKNCIIHAGAVIGSDGFGFAPTEDGSYRKIPQTGNVILEDDVEVGANTTIDRATMGSTIIRKGVKLDNLVQIAHNVEVGVNTVIAGQSGVAGSSKLGKQCVLAGQVGISGHVEIADGSVFGAQTGVPSSLKNPNGIYQGYPAVPVGVFRRSSVVYKNLPELQKTVYELQKQIEELKSKIK
ncbi:MAG: UDP-3-O-(3-hydroxymyristoyl) glucosamine N-acyltransferase [Bacteroidetes bacterium]|nr:UDP-3-O-(3-hydroxymyristoyl) glucosamine N-acyltransferase [Bacteroidota bacterium]